MKYVYICKHDKSWENGLLFWKEGGKGYTSNPDEAGLFDHPSKNTHDTVSITEQELKNLRVTKIVSYGQLAEILQRQEQFEYSTEEERLENGLCPKCEGELVKAEHAGGSAYDKTPTCRDCGYRDD